jgi:5-methyltetrahydropteroyltriglutamate--homocysteine methyltransferase
MKRSTDRILTTHTGSLPRPPALTEELVRRDRGEIDADGLADLDAQIREAVIDVVRRQADAGVAIVNDGEASKVSYSTYVKERLDGFGGQSGPRPPSPDLEAFPDFAEGQRRASTLTRPACVGPVSYRNREAVGNDIANLKAALTGDVEEAFMTAASPGVISHVLENRFYASHEEYLGALAEAMKTEYDEIHRAGFVLQLDCPDLTSVHPQEDRDAFRRRMHLHIEALNHATREIPPDAMRLHVCWGNVEAPHTGDIPLADIIDLVLGARPAAISFEAANPRHEHEWVLFQEIALPEGKVLIPGVLDSTTNYVEHPELVAQRIARYAELVGREHVIAGSDCGFATTATAPTVYPSVTWAKLQAMVEGARLASAKLWA